MPDNKVRSGKLEDFLRTLIRTDDKILPHVDDFVSRIQKNVNVVERFRDIDIEKVKMSSWLALQNPPGLPYGTAIKSNVLQCGSPVANLFVQWFKLVYSI